MSAPAHKVMQRLACRRLSHERFVLPCVHLLDPALGVDRVCDLLVADGAIEAIGDNLSGASGLEVLRDLEGCHVFPAFVDSHVHLRVPGLDYKEDMESATRAAAAGGYGIVVGMANTDPVVDEGPLAAWVLDEAEAKASVRVGQVGALSHGLKGESLAELRELADAGVCAFSDDGRPVADAGLLLTALRYLRGTGLPVLLHLEDVALTRGAVMHEGKWSARLGLRGIPSVAETGPLCRDLEVVACVAGEVGRVGTPESLSPGAGLVHFQHLSSAAAADVVAHAKQSGLPITAEVTPHHLLLTDAEVQSFDQNLKINPPLRAESDRLRLIEALAEGTIDCIGTDHAPHAPHEKEVPFEEAAYGTVGLETAFGVLHEGLVVSGALGLDRLVEAMSPGSARCLGLPAPRLEAAAPAHFCVVDLEEAWTVSPRDLLGKSRNSAFLGRPARGRVLLTVVDGTRRFARPRGQAPAGETWRI